MLKYANVGHWKVKHVIHSTL